MKMRKNAVALSVAALIGGLGMAGGASAAVITGNNPGDVTSAVDLRVSEGGVGHSLLIPYYTVQEGNRTLFSIVNTDTVNGKAVKVRFRGASNSDDVFDFQLFLSPNDVWNADISQGTDGRAVLNTQDRSCTIPQIVAGQPFVTTRFPAALTDAAKAQQTREGYIEIFNMADVRPGTALFTAIKHINGVPPNSCLSPALLNLNRDPVNEADANGLGLFVPSSGLFSNYLFINQTTGATSWSNEATSILAVQGLTGTLNQSVAGTGNIVFSPQLSQPVPRITGPGGAVTPTTNDAVTQATADPLLRLNFLQALFFDLPDMSTPYIRNLAPGGNDQNGPIRQASELSQAIATLSIRNEYSTEASISGATDWTISFPTRRYNVALNYPTNTAIYTDFTAVAPNAGTIGRPNYFSPANTTVVNNATTGNFPQICLDFRGSSNDFTTPTVKFYDREENESGQTTQFVISPGTPTAPLQFCGEVSVLSFNQGATPSSTVLRASIARKDIIATVTNTSGAQAPATSGWARISSPGLAVPGSTVGLTGGLPLLGAYYFRATNPANAGFSTNYGAAWNHRYNRVDLTSGIIRGTGSGSPGGDQNGSSSTAN